MTDYVYDTRATVDAPLIITVTAGSSKTVGLNGDTAGLCVRMIPGGGGTATLQSTLNSWAQIDAATAVWVTSSAGAVSANTDQTLLADNVRGLKLTATTANAVFHVG